MDLDADLVAAAASVLGTTKIVDTVHAALSDVVRRRQRLGLLEIENSLTLADLDEMRAHRFAESPEDYGPDRPE